MGKAGVRQQLPRSNDEMMSPGIYGQQMSDFNLADYNNDFENNELNEEIKKLLLENQL